MLRIDYRACLRMYSVFFFFFVDNNCYEFGVTAIERVHSSALLIHIDNDKAKEGKIVSLNSFFAMISSINTCN